MQANRHLDAMPPKLNGLTFASFLDREDLAALLAGKVIGLDVGGEYELLVTVARGASTPRPPLEPEPSDLPRVGQCWQHAKGGLYMVVDRARLEAAPNSWLVIYTKLGDLESPAWSRPLGEFLERFKLVP